MSRQNFMDLSIDPPLANLTAITATTETALWSAAQYTPIAANEGRVGKIWMVTAAGIMSTGGSGTLIITPRFGLTVSGVTMGASVTQTVPVSLTNVAWWMQLMCVVRTVGAPGANSTVMGNGHFQMAGVAATAGQGPGQTFGGTSATVDLSVATGITIGWTLSVAGSVTPQNVVMQSLN